jgi:hypothetical protein
LWSEQTKPNREQDRCLSSSSLRQRVTQAGNVPIVLE